MTTSVYWDPFDIEIQRDPYPTYKRLREEAPLYYNDKHDFYAVSRYEDVDRGFREWETFSSARGVILELIQANIELPPGTLIMEDPPIHDLHRALLAKVFTPRRIMALEPKIREFCERCLDPLVRTDRFDIIAELGADMPMRVIGMLLGIPEADLERVRENSDATLRTQPGERMDVAEHKIASSGDLIGEYIDWRAKNPSTDLMTELLNTEFEDENGVTRKLTRDETVTYINVLAGAGNETTSRLIGWMGTTLAQHPDQRAELVEDPSLIRNAIEEVLRYEPPGPFSARSVNRDVELHGTTVPAGSAILLMTAAANRDERKFPHPDRFDIHRDVSGHLSFAIGVHFCLGNALARLEARVALEEILKRFPTWDVDWDTAELSSTSSVRGWEKLPLVIA